MGRAVPADIGAQLFWIERPGGEAVAGAWFPPAPGTARRTAVLLVPGLGHEERASATGLATCAEALAARGFGTLLVDLHGCGQSSGRLDDADLAAHWRADLRAALAATRSCGHDRAIVVGVRLGALLAADALGASAARGMARVDPSSGAGRSDDEAVRLAGFVGWMPVTSGRRYLRELRMMAQVAPGAALSIGGFDWPAPLVAHLGGLDLRPIDARAALLLDADDQAARAFGAACSAPLEQRRARDSGAWLYGDRDEPPLPQADIAELVAWCVALDDPLASAASTAGATASATALASAVGQVAPAAGSHADARPGAGGLPGAASIELLHAGRRLREEAVEIGPGRLHGVLCRPAGVDAAGAVRLFASSVGPGRSFVDFARDQAAAGHASLRFDFAGFGTSPACAGEARGKVYAPGGRHDVESAVAHLRAAGHARVVLVGYCAGAWSMLHAGARASRSAATKLDAVVAINVQLQRAPDRRVRGVDLSGPTSRWLARIAKVRGLRGAAARLERLTAEAPLHWATTLVGAGVPLLLAYADRDPGLAHLRRHLPEAARPAGLRVDIVERLGHLMDDSEARSTLYDRLAAYLDRVDRLDARPAGASGAPAPRPVEPRPAIVHDRWTGRPLHGVRFADSMV